MARFKAEMPTDLINAFKSLETNTDKMLEEMTKAGADVVATRYYDAQGREVSKEEVLAVVGEKKMESHASAVYNVKFENIIKIGK